MVFVGFSSVISPSPGVATGTSDQHLNAKSKSKVHNLTGETSGCETEQRRFDVKQELFECCRMGHSGFEYRHRCVILGKQTRHRFESPKKQRDICFHGRESAGSKELKGGCLDILPNSAFCYPIDDLPGFSYAVIKQCTGNMLLLRCF